MRTTRRSASPCRSPACPPGPAPSIPQAVPDARSLFLGLHYSLAKLPEQPMAARRADPRVGYFDTVRQDFSDDLARTPRVHQINRWRLEKKDPTAAVSEPVKPITFWLDRTIPVKYRDAMSKGILAWNSAFERIGFKDAVVVKVQPDDADFDTLDVGVASVRWMINAQPLFGAIGPSQIDPRSGEILDADIGFESLSSRGVRALRAQVLASKVAVDWPALMQSSSEERIAQIGAQRAMAGGLDIHECQHADMAAEQLSYALDVLEARGELDPSSPEAQQWVQDYLTDTTMHEVGHTLGLRHNFRSSRVYTDAQLSDPDFARQNGLAGSVMEYAPINLSRARRTQHGGVAAARSGRTTTGRSSTATSRSRPITRRPSCNASPRAAASRSWPTAPTRTTSSASIRSRCTSTWAATRWRSPRSASTSRAT